MTEKQVEHARLLTEAITAARSVAWSGTSAACDAAAQTERNYLSFCEKNDMLPLTIEVHS